MQFMPAVLQAAAIVCGFVVGCGILWVPCPPPWASFRFFVVPVLLYLVCRSNPIHLIRHYDIKESSNSNKGQYEIMMQKMVQNMVSIQTNLAIFLEFLLQESGTSIVTLLGCTTRIRTVSWIVTRRWNWQRTPYDWLTLIH